MPSSKFEFKAVTYSYGQDAKGSPTVSINMEGDSTVLGTVLGTFTAPAGQSAGTWSWIGASFPKSGDSLQGQGSGVVKKLATGRWATSGAIAGSDGSLGKLEGEFDLANRTWSGTTDWS
ncbi:MAG: hypothetical protein AB7V42_06895 [Thermoleophilia bacterium]